MSPSRIASQITRAAVIVVVSFAVQQTARAQAVYGPRSRPTSAPHQPRLSPYLNLFRADNSLLTPYHAFVQPRQELQQNLSRQEWQIGRLEQAASRSVETFDSNANARQPTGRGGSFNNYLHFYRFNQGLHSK